jgi:hypothetical protein
MRGKGKKPPISCEERMAFLVHRWGARKHRGIAFEFTYDEWVAWWKQHLGPDWFTLRGRGAGQYVMARFGDKGPYAAGNVKCITMGENCREATQGKNRGNAKLTKEQVTAIYLEVRTGRRGTATRLARQFGVTEAAVRDIKNKMTWGHVTDLLD